VKRRIVTIYAVALTTLRTPQRPLVVHKVPATLLAVHIHILMAQVVLTYRDTSEVPV